MTTVDFKTWLTQTVGLNPKSASDVLSRLKRAEKYINLSNLHDLDYTLFEMNRNKEFQQLKPSVRSQIKRAVKLKNEFEKAFKH